MFFLSLEDVDNLRGWRVKLYELDPPSKGGSWTERGTGYVSMLLCPPVSSIESKDENSSLPNLVVLDESVIDKVLLKSPIKYDEIYERQGGKVNHLAAYLTVIYYLI